MNIERILRGLIGLSFYQAVWRFPLAIAVHVLEEAPQFTIWVNRLAWHGRVESARGWLSRSCTERRGRLIQRTAGGCYASSQ